MERSAVPLPFLDVLIYWYVLCLSVVFCHNVSTTVQDRVIYEGLLAAEHK